MEKDRIMRPPTFILSNGRKSLPSKKKLYEAGFTMYGISKSLGLDKHTIIHYFNRDHKRVGKANCRIIKQWLLDHGIISPPKPRPKHDCTSCGKTHVIKKHSHQEFINAEK